MKEELKNYTIFVDLDGVLVDFDKGYYDLTGIDISNKPIGSIPDKNFWPPIAQAGEDFWSNLEWTKDGKELWNFLKPYDPILLSASSRQNSSRVGKKKWVENNLPGVELILQKASLKKEYADPYSILIDDRESNIKDWNENGGIGILHLNTENTLNILKKRFTI